MHAGDAAGTAFSGRRCRQWKVTVLRDDINNALKEAMKAKDERKVSTLRLVNSTFKNADIEARGDRQDPVATPTFFRCCRR